MHEQPAKFNNGNNGLHLTSSGHEFDLAQLEFQKRQLQQTELRKNKKLFKNKYRDNQPDDSKNKKRIRTESYIREIISKFTIRTPIHIETVQNGTYLGIYRRSKRDPTRLYEGTSTYFSLPLTSSLRSNIITIIDSIYFEFFILTIIIINGIIIACDNPINPPSKSIEITIKIFNILFLIIYTIEMILKMLGQGIIFNGIHSYFHSGWNIMDFSVVILGYIEFLPIIDSNFAGIRAIRVLRPLRSINSIPGMKILISSLLRSLSMMGNVLLLCFGMFLFFGLLGMQFFAGKLQQKCYNINTQQFNLNGTYLCGASDNDLFECNINNNEECMASGSNPNFGITGFDNIFMSWLTVLQCISLEGWIDVAYKIQETTNKISIIYFIILIFFGSFIIINLVVGVIVNAYEFERERQEILNKQLKEIESVTSIFTSVRRSIFGKKEKDNKENVENEEDEIIKKLSPMERRREDKSYCFSLEIICFNICETNNFNKFIMGLIVLNTLVLSLEMVNEPKEWILFQDIANYVFTIIFVIEVFIKCFGYGFNQYFAEQFNRFDFVIVVLNSFEILITKFFHFEGFNGLSAFRSFRLIKVFRLARSWNVLRNLLKTIGNTLNSLIYFTAVLLLFIFIYSLLGMQFFAGYMYIDDNKSELSRANFDTFWWSIVTVFQIIGGENWNEILYVTINNTNWFLGITFCVSLFILGNYVLLNLFLAILLSNFDFNDDIDIDDDIDDIDDIDDDKTIIIKPQKQENKHLYLDNIGYTLHHKHKTLKQEITDLFRTEKVILFGSSLWCLSSTNNIRLYCSWLIQQPFFEFLVLLTICFSSIILIFDTPNLDKTSSLYSFLYISEIISTIIFLIEAIFKIIANGLYFTPSGYLKDRWNIIDLIAIIFSILDLFVGHLSFLRVVRSFRALRIIRRIQGMRVVTIAMIQSIKPVINVILISILFFFVFAILGVQIFKGLFAFCQDSNGNDLGYDKNECIESINGGIWRNPSFGNFDHIGNALLILFEMSTLEMWPNIMYRGIDITEINVAPKRDNHPHYALYFILFIICTNFFIMNLFVGVVVDHFNSAKNKLEGGILTTEQKQWVHLKKWISSQQSTSILYKKPDIFNDDKTFKHYYQLKINNNISFIELIIYYYKFYIKHKFKKLIYKLVTNDTFDYFIMICILLNTLILLTWSFGQNYEMEIFQWISNKIFTLIFTLEMILKLYGLGYLQYFSSKVNVFDFIIVIGSLIGLIFDGGFNINNIGKHNGFDPTIFRVFRILRLLRLIQRAKGLKILISTLIYALPSLSNIGWLLSLIFFIYGILGMGLFGGIPHNEDPNSFINIHCNFDNFYNSIITLFRISTGESWNGIMRQLLPNQCTFITQTDCGSYIAPLYFVSFIVIVSFIILNVFIAVILEHFEASMNEELNDKLSIKQLDVEYFNKSWSLFIEQHYKWYQPSNDSYLWIKVENFEIMLLKTNGLFGFKQKNWTKLERFNFIKKLQVPLHRKYNNKTKKNDIYLQKYQCLLAIGLIIMIQKNGKWVQSQITKHTKFAKIAIHRKTDWKIAKKLLQTNAKSINGIKLIQIIAAIKIQAMIRGYLCRKKLKNTLFI